MRIGDVVDISSVRGGDRTNAPGHVTLWTVRYIGRGRFTRAFRLYPHDGGHDGDLPQQVLLEVRTCQMKELLSKLPPNPHIPILTWVGDEPPNPRRRKDDAVFYLTPFSRTLCHRHESMALFERLRDLYRTAEHQIWKERQSTSGPSGAYGLAVNQRFLDLVAAHRLGATDISAALHDAIQDLVNRAQDYGDTIRFEWSPRNLGVHVGEDGAETLILRDVLYDRNTV